MSGQPKPNPEKEDALSVGVAMQMPREEAEAIADELGLVQVQRTTIKELSKMGVEADDLGLISIAGGSLVMTAPALCELLERVLAVARKPKVSDKTVLACGVVGAALGKSIQGISTAVKADGLLTKAKKEVRQMPRRTLGTVTNLTKPSIAA